MSPAGKPDPEPYREAAHRFGLPAAAVVAVEDSGAYPLRAGGGAVRRRLFAFGEPFVGADRSIAHLAEVPALFGV